MDQPRVLIVDDDRATRAALFTLFVQQGWDAVMTPTVAGALAHLDPAPDAVVLDLMLPDGDGEEVLRAVRSRELTTCVAVCTGSEDPDRLAALAALGPVAVLRKPVNIADVIAACSLTRC